jgi:hypothetical protein
MQWPIRVSIGNGWGGCGVMTFADTVLMYQVPSGLYVCEGDRWWRLWSTPRLPIVVAYRVRPPAVANDTPRA